MDKIDNNIPEPVNELSRRFREFCERCDDAARRYRHELNRAWLEQEYGFDVLGEYAD